MASQKIKKSDTKEDVNKFSYIYAIRPSQKHIEKEFGTDTKHDFSKILKIGRSGDTENRFKSYTIGGKNKGLVAFHKWRDVIIKREDEEKVETELKNAFKKEYKGSNIKKGKTSTEYYQHIEGMLPLFDKITDKYKIKDLSECKDENADLHEQIKNLQSLINELTLNNDKLIIKNDTLRNEIEKYKNAVNNPINLDFKQFEGYFDEKKIKTDINLFVSNITTHEINNEKTFNKKLSQIKSYIDSKVSIKTVLRATYSKPEFLKNISDFDFNTPFYKTYMISQLLQTTKIPYVLGIDILLTSKLLEINYYIIYKSLNTGNSDIKEATGPIIEDLPDL
jgi:hypothetical protein